MPSSSSPPSSSNPGYRRVVKTLRPQQPGTLKLTRRYGDALVCVRYRVSPEGKLRYTTVELVIDEAPLQRRLTERSIVNVRIDWGEVELGRRAKAMGAKWDAATKLWRMSLRTARALQIPHRIRPPLPKDRQKS